MKAEEKVDNEDEREVSLGKKNRSCFTFTYLLASYLLSLLETLTLTWGESNNNEKR